jgi:hypothetical protein
LPFKRHFPAKGECGTALVEGAMTERDLTEREDRLMFWGLAAAAILISLLFIL